MVHTLWILLKHSELKRVFFWLEASREYNVDEIFFITKWKAFGDTRRSSLLQHKGKILTCARPLLLHSLCHAPYPELFSHSKQLALVLFKYPESFQKSFDKNRSMWNSHILLFPPQYAKSLYSNEIYRTFSKE